VEDFDIDYIVLSVMTPMMLVKAWEAIVLEKKVLVVSSTDSIITACCEFLRRMVSPLVIVNTYVPLLPLQLIDAVDAPFPYLLGTNTKLLKDNIVDLSDTVVIDLDTRRVVPRVVKSDRPEVNASIALISKLAQEVSDIMLLPLGEWFHRTSDANTHPSLSPFSEHSYISRATRIQHVFKRTNLDLMSARNCTVRAFWRRPAEALLQTPALSAADGKAPASVPRKIGNTMMGFNYQDGVCSGFMQLAKELHDENDLISHFTPCWVEMDQCVLSIYQHADDLPILYILLKDIETVSPCAIEPEGHVFEMVIKDQSSYRFTVTDTESRQKWISTIDRRKSMDFSGYNDDQAFLDQNFSTKPRYSEVEMSNVDSGYSMVGNNVANANANGGAGANGAPSPYISIWDGFELISKPREPVDPYAPPASVPTNAAAGAVVDEPNAGSTFAPTSGSTVTLGFPQACPPIYPESAAVCAKEDSLFRFEFSRTQTMNYIHQKVECGEFQAIFKDLKIKAETLLGSTYGLDGNLNVVMTSALDAAEEEEFQKGLTRTASEGTAFDSSATSSRRDDAPALQRMNTTTSMSTQSTAALNDPPKKSSSSRLSSKMFGGFFQKKPSLEVSQVFKFLGGDITMSYTPRAHRLTVLTDAVCPFSAAVFPLAGRAGGQSEAGAGARAGGRAAAHPPDPGETQGRAAVADLRGHRHLPAHAGRAQRSHCGGKRSPL
jgi:hypothetical protein